MHLPDPQYGNPRVQPLYCQLHISSCAREAIPTNQVLRGRSIFFQLLPLETASDICTQKSPLFPLPRAHASARPVGKSTSPPPTDTERSNTMPDQQHATAADLNQFLALAEKIVGFEL